MQTEQLEGTLQKIWNKTLTFLGWVSGLLFILFSLPFYGSEFFLALFFLIAGASFLPPVNRRLPRMRMGARVLLLLVLFVGGIMADSHFSNEAKKKEAVIAAQERQKDEEERQQKLAAFEPIKQETIEKLNALMDEEKYGEALSVSKEYADLGDIELETLHRTAEYKMKREALLSKLKDTKTDHSAAVKDAAKYQAVADADFIKAYEAAIKAQNYRNQRAAAAPYIERLQRELDSLNKNGIEVLKTADGFQIVLAVFAAYAINIEEAQKYDLVPEDKAVLERFKKKVASEQKRVFPIIRDAYGPLAREKGWVHDMSVRTFGPGYRTIEFVAGMFAANRNIQGFAEGMTETMALYRFKRIRFKWYEDADKYTYYDLDTPKDTDFVIWENGDYRIVR